MDSVKPTETTTEATTTAKPAVVKKSYSKINLYVAFLLLVTAGVGPFIDMQPKVAIPLVCLAVLLVSKYILSEVGDMHERIERVKNS